MPKRIFLTVCTFIAFAIGIFAQESKPAKEIVAMEKTPISYGVLVDNSGSYRTIFETVVKTVDKIFEANETDDEAFLVRFVDSTKISVMQDLTNSKDELRSASDELFIEGGQTAILDGVYFAAKYLAAQNVADNRRKVLILITDGEDRNSTAKSEEVLSFLKKEKIQVYALGLSDGKIYKGLLDKLAKETGGKSIAVEKRGELESYIKQLNTAIRAR